MKNVKTLRSIFVPSVLLALAWLAPGTMAQTAEWTFLVYLDGDNNLEEAGIDDFLEMASVGSNADVKIVVQFDRISGYDSSYDDWTDTRRGIVNSGDVPDASWGSSIGEANMGDPATLVAFVEWGMQNYPASRYAVVLWDHGSGWRRREEPPPFKAVCWDDSSGGDSLRMQEVRTALQTIETNEQQPDLLGLDACLMAMVEVAYEIREHADVMVGSERSVPNDGWPYNNILGVLVGDPTMSAAELGAGIVLLYYASYGGSQTHSATDLPEVGSLASTVDSLAQTLIDKWNSDAGACVADAYSVMLAVATAVIEEAHGASWAGSHGLAIYFPENSGDFNSAYDGTTILFPADTHWEEFLLEFYASMTGSWVADARDQAQEYDVTGLGDYWHIDLYDFCDELIENASGVLWADFAYVGVEIGTFDQPYNTLGEAVAAASAGHTICIKPGSSAETLTINKELTLRAAGGTATIGD
jgi:hypothetical protein